MATVCTDAMQAIGATPETILPAQLVAGSLQAAALQPEKRLMLAVLEDAIATLRRQVLARGPRGRRLFAETKAWCVSESTDTPFTFVNVCDALGLDVEYVRAGLRRWLERERAARGGATIVVHTPFRRVGGSRTRVTALRYSA